MNFSSEARNQSTSISEQTAPPAEAPGQDKGMKGKM